MLGFTDSGRLDQFHTGGLIETFARIKVIAIVVFTGADRPEMINWPVGNVTVANDEKAGIRQVVCEGVAIIADVSGLTHQKMWSNVMRLGFEQLESRIVLANSIIEAEPNNSIEDAQYLQEFVDEAQLYVIEGSFSPGTDEDFYEFSVNKSGSLFSVEAFDFESGFASAQAALDADHPDAIEEIRDSGSILTSDNNLHRSHRLGLTTGSVWDDKWGVNSRFLSDFLIRDPSPSGIPSGKLRTESYVVLGEAVEGIANASVNFQADFFSGWGGELLIEQRLRQSSNYPTDVYCRPALFNLYCVDDTTTVVRLGENVVSASIPFRYENSVNSFENDFRIPINASAEAQQFGIDHVRGNVHDSNAVGTETSYDWRIRHTGRPVIELYRLDSDGEPLLIAVDPLRIERYLGVGQYLMRLATREAISGESNYTIKLQLVADIPHAWIVHGWNPIGLLQGDKGWSNFRADWQKGGAYYEATEEALGGFGNNAIIHSVGWDSSRGWNAAIGGVIAKLVLSKLAAFDAAPAIAKDVVYEILDEVIVRGLAEGKAISERVSSAVAADILRVSQAGARSITLVGHSRGGTVASRSHNAVRGTLDSLDIPNQSIILDAFGTDWPGISTVLGSYTPSGDNADLNVRVADGLLEIGLGQNLGTQVLRDFLSYVIGDLVPEDIVPDDLPLIGNAAWRAPSRPHMRELLLPTNHVGVSGAFFSLPDLASYFEANRGGGGEGLGSAQETNATRATGIAGRPVEIADAWRRLAEGKPRIDGLPEFASMLVDGLLDPDSWVRRYWRTDGSVFFDIRDPSIQLWSDLSSISQEVSIPAGQNTLHIEADVPYGGGLAVEFDGELIGEFTQAGVVDAVSLAFAFPAAGPEGLTGELRIRRPPTGTFGGVNINDVSIGVLAEVPQVRTAAYDGTSLVLDVFGPDPEELAEYTFFSESNGEPGLQLGENGDTQLAMIAGENGTQLRVESGIRQFATIYAAQQVMSSWQFVEITLQNDFHTNLMNRLDTNFDGHVSPIDVLLGVNFLNSGSHESDLAKYIDPPLDVNMDKSVSPIDILLIINELNRKSGEGERARDVVADELSQDFCSVVDFTDLEKQRRKHAIVSLQRLE